MTETDILNCYQQAMTAIGAGATATTDRNDTHALREALGHAGHAFTQACNMQPGLDPIRAVAGPGAVVVRVGMAVLVNLDRPTPGQLVARVLAAARSALGSADSFNLVVFGREHRGVA